MIEAFVKSPTFAQGSQIWATGYVDLQASRKGWATRAGLPYNPAVLTDDDKKWITEQLERVGTTLLTEFHKSAAPVEMRQRSHAAAIRALDAEVESLSDRLKDLEGR